MKKYSAVIIAIFWIAFVATGCEETKKTPEPATKTPATKNVEKKDGKTPAAKGDAKKPDAKAGSAPAAKKNEPAKVAEADGKGGLVVKSELYKLKFTVPDKWKVDKSPTGISVSSPDGEILMIVAGSKSQDLVEAALNDLKANLKFKDVNIAKQGTTVLNGLVGLRGEGDATLIENEKEQPIHFVAFSSKVNEKAVTVLLFSSKERYTKDQDTIEGILNTVGKL